jgi:tetratricopeptide (TPR) repeat protein
MVMPELRCISDIDLHAYLVGKLPARLGATVAAHLEVCTECGRRASALDASADALIVSLRQSLRPTGALEVTPVEDASPSVGTDPAQGTAQAPERIGAYRVLDEVGRGGVAVVYRARQDNPERIVALKVLLAGSHSSAERRARFRTEADTIARLRHPNIVQVYEAGQHDGLPFLALEFCDGGSLALQLAGMPQPPASAAQRMELLARAVHHAHQAGVVHRDLKPANVLLTADGQLKVGDFGLAKAERPEITATGTVIGTPSYMAPEQADGRREVGPAADVYALGAMLYELLTGRPPFQGATALETLEQVRGQEPVPPRQLQPRVPRDLETVCLKCLEKEPGRRYGSAEFLADDLRRFQEGRPVQARPVSAAGRTWRWARRNPGWACAVSVLAGLLVTIAVGASVMTWHLNKALRTANDEKHKTEEAEADTRAFADFLANQVLAASRPEGVMAGVGVNVTMAEALEKAEKQIDQVFAGRPRAEAAARHALGDTWRYLGRFHDAVRDLRRAVDLRIQTLGPDADETLAAKHSLAKAYVEAGQTDLGLPLAEEVLTTRTDHLGPEHADTLTTLVGLANLYLQAEQPGRAFPLLVQSLPLMQKTLGPDHSTTLNCQVGLATAYRLKGQLDKAVPLFEQVLARQEKTLGDSNPYTLQTMNSLAQAYRDAGQMGRAVPLFERVLAKVKEKFGADHADTLICMNNLAEAYQNAGQLDRALPLYEQALRKHEAKPGPDHPNTLLIMGNLGTAYQAADQFERALPLLQQTLARSEKVLGHDHPNTLSNRTNLAALYWAMHKFDQAIPLFEAVLPVYEKGHGASHPLTILTAFNLAVNLRDADRLDKAAGVCDQWLPHALTALKPDHPTRRFVVGAAGDIYSRTGRHDKAEPLLREQAELVKQEAGADSSAFAAQLMLISQNLLAQNKFADAEVLLRQSLAIRRKKTPDDWTTFNTQSMLGGALMGQRKYAEAEPLLVQGYEGMKQRAAKIPPQGRTRPAEAMERLVRLYEGWGKSKVAVAWRQALEE